MLLLKENIPPEQVANFAISVIDDLFSLVGLPRNGDIEQFTYTVFVIAVSFLSGWIIRRIVLTTFHKMIKDDKHGWIKNLRSAKVLTRASHVLPPLIYLALLPFAFHPSSKTLKYMMGAGVIYLIASFVLAVNALLAWLWHRYDEHDNVNNHPLKGLLQVSQGLAWMLGLILCVSFIIGKSPVTLLTGLGAFAAILMLVFKDSILGVVSGVQLSQNDMLRVGDWIVVPGTLANGTVIDVSLTVVKIKNWDNTIVMLPPYTLVSTSFQNWRGMSDSGVRRIAMSYNIDLDSVQFSTPAMLEDFKKIPFMNDYISAKLQQQANGKVENANNSAGLVNGTIETNLGMFRAYLTMYLMHKKDISQRPQDTLMVLPLAPTTSGIPFQIYCFAATTNWVTYEAIVGEVLEHVAAMLPRFGLYVFENPSGRDTVNQGFLEGGYHANQVYGLPYQSIYNWDPGENKYPDSAGYKYWDSPLPQNRAFDAPPRSATSEDTAGKTTQAQAPVSPASPS